MPDYSKMTKIKCTNPDCYEEMWLYNSEIKKRKNHYCSRFCHNYHRRLKWIRKTDKQRYMFRMVNGEKNNLRLIDIGADMNLYRK